MEIKSYHRNSAYVGMHACYQTKNQTPFIPSHPIPYPPPKLRLYSYQHTLTMSTTSTTSTHHRISLRDNPRSVEFVIQHREERLDLGGRPEQPRPERQRSRVDLAVEIPEHVFNRNQLFLRAVVQRVPRHLAEKLLDVGVGHAHARAHLGGERGEGDPGAPPGDALGQEVAQGQAGAGVVEVARAPDLADELAEDAHDHVVAVAVRPPGHQVRRRVRHRQQRLDRTPLAAHLAPRAEHAHREARLLRPLPRVEEPRHQLRYVPLPLVPLAPPTYLGYLDWHRCREGFF
ncbi:hypothetical protein M426DRAFT_89938 [Hypoxylon sp. CI-4A]|nr:hypothetical protein M426DRAFT_89938 [Hypoxylon sp. CI-4A]